MRDSCVYAVVVGFLLLSAGCFVGADVVATNKKKLELSDSEKVMRYDAIHDMCMEDAFTIGYAAAHFGHEAWAEMIREMNQSRPPWMQQPVPYIPAK
jgi:hypothetical protein